MIVPIFTSPGRSKFNLQLSLSYDSGSGSGPFGFGWSLSDPAGNLLACLRCGKACHQCAPHSV